MPTQALRHNCCRDDPILVVSNKPRNAYSGIKTKSFVILFVSRLIEVTNPEMPTQALRHVHEFSCRFRVLPGNKPRNAYSGIKTYLPRLRRHLLSSSNKPRNAYSGIKTGYLLVN